MIRDAIHIHRGGKRVHLFLYGKEIGQHDAASDQADAIERLGAELTRDDWQPIETAPKDGSRIFGWAKEWSEPATVQHYPRGWGQADDLGPFLYQPTHWMPLPEPPKA